MSEPHLDLTSGLAGFPVENPPGSLYHFYPSWCRFALTRGFLNFTRPRYFNDPFEIWAGVATDGLSEADVLRSVRAETGIFRAAMDAHNPGLMSNAAEYDRRITSVVTSRPDLAQEHLGSILKSIRDTCLDGMGISCFSAFPAPVFTGPIGIRHWSMYADSHRGFAIEYDGCHDYFQQWAASKWMFQIRYTAERLLVPLAEYDVWNDSRMWKTFRQWSAMKCLDAWGHESEWRIVCPFGAGSAVRFAVCEQNEQGEQRDYLPLWQEDADVARKQAAAQAIRRVVLGVGASQDLVDAVREAVTVPHLSHVEILWARVCPKSFGLNLERIH